MEEIVKKIRSVLISTKGKSDLRALQRDYKMILGEDIPYRQLGYGNLTEFIKKAPGLKVSQAGHSILVEAIKSESSKHMVDLISKQKSPRRRSNGRFPPRHLLGARRRAGRPPQQSAPANQGWRAPYVGRSRPRPHVHQLVVSVNGNYISPGGHTSVQQQLQHSTTSSPSPPLPLPQPAAPPELIITRTANSRLVRSISSPGTGSQQPERIKQTTPPPMSMQVQHSPTPTISSSRPRMRSHQSFTDGFVSSSTPIIAGISNSAIRHPSPTLNQTQIEQLMREGIAQFDPNSSVWRWSSSDDSNSPQRPSLNKDTSPNSGTNSTSSTAGSENGTTTSTTTTTLTSRNDALDELISFVRTLRIEDPKVRVLPRACKSHQNPRLYDCSIKVDNHSYSSYPRDCKSPVAAKTAAAQAALDDLKTRHSAEQRRQSKHLLISTEHDVLTRIPPIIRTHFHGLWAAQLALDYEDKYGEQLPPNWLALLDTLPDIAVEPTVDSRYVLKYCKTGEKLGPRSSMSSNPLDQQTHPTSDVSVPRNTIKLTEEGWLVEITHAASTVEVWCRCLDSSSARFYSNTADEMQKYYRLAGGAERATNVAVAGFYVAFFDECWSRVRVIATREHEVTCFFIDFGDEQVVPRSDIYVLRREFAREQEQAFVCRLSGLEELANMKAAPDRLAYIDGRTFHAKPQLHEVSEADLEGPSAIAIVLYECETPDDDSTPADPESEPYTENDNINLRLIRQITSDSFRPLKSSGLNAVYVTHATDSGDLYVQPHCEALTKLTELIQALDSVDFSTEFPGNHIPPREETSPEEDAKRLFLARREQNGGDGRMYRALVTDRSPCGQYALLYFVDLGNSQIVSLAEQKEVYPLKRISEVLCAFPPLAVRVRLDIELKVDAKTGEEKDFAKRVQELMPSDSVVLLTVVNNYKDSDGISTPICEMFRRSETHGQIFSVSASLRYGGSTSNGDDDITGDGNKTNNNNNHHHSADKSTQLARKLERLKSVSSLDIGVNKPVPSTGILSMPDLPGPNSLLDVRIPFAVNPWNFFVQPYKSAGELHELMEQLQQRYGGDGFGNGFLRPNERVQLEDVIPGRIYASQHTDGNWYRTSVIKVINSGSISVFFCDVGYYANLTVGQLVALDPIFLKLPYQAIKARLAGIQPRAAKWSMEDCQYFENLVRAKNFVSIVVDKQQDELYKCDVVLVLKLIDTSTEQDIFVDKLLIDKGIAAPANK